MRFPKNQRTGLEHQAPNPKIEIFTRGNPSESDTTYSADPLAGVGSKLLSYTFSEAVDDLEGWFSFSVVNDEMGDGVMSAFDVIPLRSVVKIYEGSEQPAFIGIIRRRHLGKAMTSQGIKQSITFSGKSIISCITEYAVSLDVRIQGVMGFESKTMELTIELARDDLTIKNFMIKTWKHFKKTSERAGISTTGLADIINKFIGGGDPGNFIEVHGKETKFRYNIACAFYSATNNLIADVWRNILPEKVYELFSRCSNGEPKIVARQVPFNPDEWSALDIYEISPLSLINYDLDQNDEEVYTAFASYIIGSAMSREFYLAVNQPGDDSIVKHYEEKQRIYGFRPLELDFHGYDRKGNVNGEERDKLTKALKELNEMAAYWYSRLDEMYSGSITVITDFNKPETNPKAGCRADFLGCEFYIDKAEHAWSYGGTPTIKLTVSRGASYSFHGDMHQGMIIPIGMKNREFIEGYVPAVEIVGFRPAEGYVPAVEIVDFRPAK